MYIDERTPGLPRVVNVYPMHHGYGVAFIPDQPLGIVGIL